MRSQFVHSARGLLKDRPSFSAELEQNFDRLSAPANSGSPYLPAAAARFKHILTNANLLYSR